MKDNFKDKKIFFTEIFKENFKQNVNYMENIAGENSECYIFSFSQESISFLKFLQKVNEECSLKNIDLPKMSGIENKILYINFIDDHKNYKKMDINP